MLKKKWMTGHYQEALNMTIEYADDIPGNKYLKCIGNKIIRKI